MEQGQDLARAATDICVRLRGGLAVWSPTAARVRHSLERTGLVLAPHRQAKPSALRIGLLEQPLFTTASGSVTLTRPPCLRLRTTTPVSHQVRLFCQPKPAACRGRPIVSGLMPGRPSGAWRSAVRSVLNDQLAVPSRARSGGRATSARVRRCLDLAIASPMA